MRRPNLQFSYFKIILMTWLSLALPIRHSVFAAGLDYTELLKTRPARDVIWIFNAELIGYNLIVPDDSKIDGPGADITFGYGQQKQTQWYLIQAKYLTGPWYTSGRRTFDQDFGGMAFEAEFGKGIELFSFDARSSPFASMTLGYMNLGGKNLGDNHSNTGNPNDKSNYFLDQEFKISMDVLYLTPNIGWRWSKSPRPQGNEQELLATRVEASFLKIGMSIPLVSKSRVEVIRRDPTDDLTQVPTSKFTNGRVRGFTVVASTGVWLGI